MKWLILIIAMLFNCNGSIQQTTKTSLLTKLDDLESRNYKIGYVSQDRSKEPYNLRTTEKTQILNGDLKSICAIKSITGIEFNSSVIQQSFVNEIELCDLQIVKFLRFENVIVQPELICNLSKAKNIKWLSFIQTNINDELLRCVSKIASIETFDLTGINNTYTDEGFCKFAKSGIKIKNLSMYEATLTKKGYDCLTDIPGIEIMSFKKWKNFSKQEMNAVKDLYFKKHGKKIVIGTFEYDKL